MRFTFTYTTQDGKEHRVPLEVVSQDPQKSVYQFLVHLLLMVIDTREVKSAELFQRDEYIQSYEPRYGWYDKNKGKGGSS